MTDPVGYIPRINVSINEDQANALRDLLPWGTRREVFSKIVDMLINLLKSCETGVERDRALGAVLKGHICFTIKEEKNGNATKHSPKHTRPTSVGGGADPSVD